ncbi:ABC transporter substrate-binding protein [Roseomonas xinghualingensis]|uniref:ABC transporter substrate-binding protein n=1 Tax=Roseomonas xinghualingensis TaxID=2986475 RepID=UPI0021F1A36A|nr:ABC transporter substrate-binding protein [Roseomonas sp. SXEYE001]MCV4207642.1 ABC transporter substrate-binding protein [Roseomonas sp. SXEYE001]
MAKWTRAGLALLGLALLMAGMAQAQTRPPAEVVRTLAPSGTLRAAINFGNPVLAQRDPMTGAPRGVSAELAAELGRRLGVPVEFVTYDSAGRVTDAGKQGAWDVAFLAIDPVRAAGILFTAPYVIIEGTYMVRADSPLRSIEEVDRQGHRISVGRGSAYDLYLTRALKNAEIIRAPSSPEAIDIFLRDRLDAAAGVKQPLVDYAKTRPEFRVIPGRFMVIEQAVGIPQGREAGIGFMRAFVEEMKSSGFIARALEASNQGDATVAPPAP